MPRNICIFSDGTGQGGEAATAKTKSNVRLLFEACSKNGVLIPVSNQICFYDPGLGSDPDSQEGASPLTLVYKWLSRATGLGITKNIVDCYAALIAHWQPGDRIFLFGFSRGAYTVRSLGGVLKLCGIPTNARKGDSHQDRLANTQIATEAVKGVYMSAYDWKGTAESSQIALKKRQAKAKPFRENYKCEDCAPYFVGVWDTVRALGVPTSNAASKLLSNGIELLFRHKFHDDTLDQRVPFARHALAIDENRAVFKPALWNPESFANHQNVKQRWFAGVHCDVGGGYDDCRKLADITLDWMVKEASRLPESLLFDPNYPSLLSAHDASTNKIPDAALGKQHDERVESIFPWKYGTREKDLSEFSNIDLHPQVKNRLGKNVEILDFYDQIAKKRTYRATQYQPSLGTHSQTFSD